MKYRPEIDGLRTVAVVPVILFHAHLAPFTGGFIGVDVFFVISGYLITSLLMSDLENDRFSILNFYERRARRILPALFLVMAACIPFSLLWMFPLELNDFAQSVFATTAFASNILFWLEAGYFAPNSELKPLLHTWSLAIEEQYYIFFPLLLALIWHGRRRTTLAAICFGAISLLSFAFAVVFVVRWPDAAFYLLPTRAWELLAGALAAIALARGAVSPNGAMSLIGLCLIATGLVLSDDALWPSWMTLLPVGGAVLIILFAAPAQIIGRLLASPPFVGIGLISYSAYLWHQPLLAFLRLRVPEEPSTRAYIGVVMLTLALAYLTWRFVERPFRARQADAKPLVSGKQILTSSVVGAALLLGFGLYVDRSDGLPGRTAPSGMAFAGITAKVAAERVSTTPCDTDISFKPVNTRPLTGCIFPAPEVVRNGRKAILIGDSHATVMSAEIRNVLNKAGYEVSLMTFGGCLPFPGFSLAGRDCDAANRAVYSHLETLHYDLILIAARPQYLLTSDSRPVVFQVAGSGPPAERMLGLIEKAIRRLHGLGSTIIYFDPVPEMPFDIGQYIRKRYAFDRETHQISFASPYADYLDRAGTMLDLLDRLSGDGFIRISPADLLCTPTGGCVGIEGGVPRYADDNHLGRHGITMLMAKTREVLNQLPR